MIDTRTLFEYELKGVRHTVAQLCDVLPALAEATSDDQLKEVFKGFLRDTRAHSKMLEELCSDIEIKPAKDCRYADVLVKEARNMINMNARGAVKDNAFTAFMMRTLHHLQAAYTNALFYTHSLPGLGCEDELEMMDENLNETLANLKSFLLVQMADKAVA